MAEAMTDAITFTLMSLPRPCIKDAITKCGERWRARLSWREPPG